MRYEICFLLFVSVCFCERTISKNVTKTLKHQHTNKTNNCKRLNCPISEELKCIKLRNKKFNNSKEIHIIVLNKCEIDYIKCHDGLEATLVPMKNCEKPTTERSIMKRPKRSPKIVTSKNNSTIKSRRNKIPYKSNRIDYSKLYFGPHRRDNIEDTEETRNGVDEEIKIIIQDNMDGKEKMSFKADGEDKVNPLQGSESNYDGSNDNQDDSSDHDDGHENYSDDHDNDSKDHNSDGEGSEINVELNIDKKELKQSVSEEQKVVNTVGFADDDGPDIAGAHVQYLPPEFGQQMGTSIEIVDRINENEVQNAKIDSSTENHQKENPDVPNSSDSNVNNEYTEMDCPSECPSRDVMVCARCRAGVYRTFLSVCHLRMFSCNHPEEKLELVSRRPCVLSAPFLTGMKTKGRHKDPNDEDIVLKYIRCRDRGDNNDPKCKFTKVDRKDNRLRKI